jgi:spermidine synthase
VLGRLYGWNTLGAVAGAVAGEAALIGWFGVRGTAWVAAGCNALAAAVAFGLARRLPAIPPHSVATIPDASSPPRLTARAIRLCVAAFASGGILLALEVVWFRFLHLFVHSGSLVFALLLASVLTGIGLGGFGGGFWCRRDPRASRHAGAVAWGSGVTSVVVYAAFAIVVEPYRGLYSTQPLDVLWLAFALTLPVSFLSGVLFTLVGTALHEELGVDTRAAGLATLSNTVGAGLGSLVAGFVLLPQLGMERSFFLLAATYGVVALLLLPVPRQEPSTRRFLVPSALAAVFVAALALFPLGSMDERYLRFRVLRIDPEQEYEVVALREGRTETIFYLQKNLGGEPVHRWLITDGFSMSSTAAVARRYMKLFVYLPVALRPDPESALLISYGVGSTAKALTDTRSLTRIDVVDTSREILELSDIVFPDPADHPLRDPRVRVHVEDGRYFLETTTERYDLITGEPPPPKMAGVVNLFTREYFQLIYDRLTEGGMSTYWLPVHGLTESDTRSIIRAYCDVFDDCTLWGGKFFDWILVGSRKAHFEPREAELVRQWEDPAVARELRALAIERPEQLGALFMGDAPSLRRRVRDADPLTDDHPKRIENRMADPARDWRGLARWMETNAARRRFRDSEFIGRAWPEPLRARTLPYFDTQRTINEVTARPFLKPTWRRQMVNLHAVLTETDLRTLVLWLLDTDADALRAIDRSIARGDPAGPHAMELGARALADRDFERAAHYFEGAVAHEPANPSAFHYQLYALCLAGRVAEAERVVERSPERLRSDGRDGGFWIWMSETFGLRNPHRG